MTLTTDVVPSPTSWSCNSAKSTKIFAAGCSISRSFNIVAPSFVIVTSYKKIIIYSQIKIFILNQSDKGYQELLTPISSTSILSKPSGPRLLFTMFESDIAAITKIWLNFLIWAI